ncbi:MAG: trypsin-like peptidase domain-containing protein [Acidobacteriota bacterium]|nr:MAG: trypsin-like peptidase domain-containing protein [Acidobacteriota bacterium]
MHVRGMVRPWLCHPILVIAVTATLGEAAFAADGVKPASWRSTGLTELSRVERLVMPPVDVAALIDEDEAACCDLEKPLRVGYPMKTDISPADSGTWETLADGSRVWRVRIASPDALWIVLGFGTFRLQEGGVLYVYDPARARLLGGFRAEDARYHGQLWMPPIEVDEIVVELNWPKSRRDEQPNIHLGTVSHGYKPWGGYGQARQSAAGTDEGGKLDAGACNIDVNCPLGDDWQDEKRAVVNLLSGGSGYCSGSLVTNTGRDCRNYVLTAAHCTSSQGGAAGTTFQFNFERPGCDTGTAPTDQTLSGSTLRATYGPSDFTLLEMDDVPPEAFGVFYNGWSRSTTAGTESWCIHHPRNDEKKISFNEDPLVNGQNWGPDHWRVTEWEQGTTEPGSSGSPLYDQNHHVVGQLHGGTASCSSITYDEYGKFDVSWTGGGSPSSRLSDWLDPVGTGVISENGLDHQVCLNPGPRLSYETHVIDDASGNANGALDPGETIMLEVSIDNAANSGATSVAGTLTSSNTLVSITDDNADWPDVPGLEARASHPPHFTLTLDAAQPCGEPVEFTLVNTAAEDPGSWESTFGVDVGQSTVEQQYGDDMESGENGWTWVVLEGANQWVQNEFDANSATHSWASPNIARRSDTVLLMPEQAPLPSDARLRFWQRYNTENNRDGGVLEYTTDGSNWTDAGSLILASPYNSSINPSANSPLAGRDAWAGDSDGWHLVVVDLSSLAGQTARFRWRFATDGSVSDEAWYIDDVVIDVTTFTCDEVLAIPGEASDPASFGLPFIIEPDPGGYLLSWSEPLTGGAVSGYKLYRTDLLQMGPIDPQCEANLGSGTSAVVADLTDDQGYMVVARNDAGEGSYGTDSADQERPAAQGPDICP